MQLNIMYDMGSAGWTLPTKARDATGDRRSVQFGLIGTGAISATIKLYGMNDNRFPEEIATVVLNGTNKVSESMRDDFPWEWYQAELVAISGSDAVASVAASI